jgi:hypothetical protein
VLRDAAVPFEAEESNVDETVIKTAGLAGRKSAASFAKDLTCTKAVAVSGRHAGSLVIDWRRKRRLNDVRALEGVLYAAAGTAA